MTDDKNNTKSEYIIPSEDGVHKLVTYEQVIEFFQDTLQKNDSYPCPVCGEHKKAVHTYHQPAPTFPVVVNFNIVPDSPQDPSVLFAIVVQCDLCGKIDFFHIAKLLEWLRTKNGSKESATNKE